MPASRPARRAVIVGINRYTHPLSSDEVALGAGRDCAPALRWTDLLGAVPDAWDFQELLTRRFDFELEHCKLLTNEEATREGIRQALEEVLVGPAEAGDELVFYYSGHGSRVPNSLSPEPDGMDESLVPSDSARGALDLRDKELRRLLHPVLERKARLTAILDSCHSGSALRGLPGWAQRRGVVPDTRDAADPGPWGPTLEASGALVLSACQDDQGAWETAEDGRPRGAFSRAFFRVLAEAGGDESVEALFLRSKALLQLGTRFQEPVLGGPKERWSAKIFGTEKVRSRRLIAVGRVGEDGLLGLQGGWVHGLAVGSGLVRSRHAGEGGRVRVTEVLGPVSATGLQVGGEDAPLAVGDLLAVDARQVAVESPLKVFVPTAAEGWRKTVAWVEGLRRRAEAAGLGWAEDPVSADVGVVMSPRGEAWALTGGDGRILPIEHEDRAERVIELARNLGAGRDLFVSLPASEALAEALVEGFGQDSDAVEVVEDPSAADYLLTGRWNAGGVEYAWVRPEVLAEDDLASALPLRTDFHRLGEDDRTGAEQLAWLLREVALRLAKIRSWLTLESPRADTWGYELALEVGGRRVTGGGELLQGEVYSPLLLRSNGEGRNRLERRWVYVLTLDSFGKVQLLYPVSAFGNVENRFPLDEREAPETIRLPCGRGYRIGAPFGVDFFFLLTSAEAVPNPWILESEGVRLRGEGSPSALERLLTGRGAVLRGSEPVAVPKAWSLERFSIRTRGRVVGDLEAEATEPAVRMRAPV
ncbi:MAG TPA: caspase family protein [Thermoanaerobaculia bacterium]|nr:caspase family protein [Thermoanaerobaculia bacterium]